MSQIYVSYKHSYISLESYFYRASAIFCAKIYAQMTDKSKVESWSFHNF